jgi:hypothetical protein
MIEGCPSNRSGCFAENDVSGTDCVFVKPCFPERFKTVDNSLTGEKP